MSNIVYLDTSALLKRYISEKGSQELSQAWETFDLTATCLLTRAEMGAALAKAQRLGWLEAQAAQQAWEVFLDEWSALTLIETTPAVVNLAGDLAWKAGLRGYDAVHLASALTCQDYLAEPITLATFDRRLWNATREAGLTVWPEAV